MTAAGPRHFDVVIVGAGLSGIGAGYRLQTMCPDKSYALLEARRRLGGTWDLFRYPGVRSDSDMFTLGYPFRPWEDARTIADGASILRYLEDTASVYGIDRHISYGRRVTTACWSPQDDCWRLETAGLDGAAGPPYSCRFLYLCSGYYDYESGHVPEFPGEADFAGAIVHPQHWPEALDYAGKRVVVIGSGATAVTLVPAMASKAAHVTMLQRSPSYVASLPARDPIAEKLTRVLPNGLAHAIVRWKNILFQIGFYQFSRRRPERARRLLLAGVTRALTPGYPVDPHFSPRYDPWDQRMCLVPDADLFRAIRQGRASVETDEIDRFTPDGLLLRSGTTLEADIVVTATGLRLLPLGGIHIEVDGTALEPGETFVYRGFMLSGVPNLAISIGYTNASWTLRADLSSRSVCKLLQRMDARGAATATPVLDEPSAAEPEALLNLRSGYVLRSAAAMPKQGRHAPWRLRQNYLLDFVDARLGKLDARLLYGDALSSADRCPSASRGRAASQGARRGRSRR